MGLTNKQQKDLETIKYFIPDCLKNIEITDDDVIKFFEYSDKGMHKEDIKGNYFNDGFNVLIQGKRWRGIHIHELWEQGILDGSVPYMVLVEDMPRSVVDFMKKEMFQGRDADVIERCYKMINK